MPQSKDSRSSAVVILDGLACGRPGCPCTAAARRGRGTTHCPGHADGNPSLKVMPSSEVGALVHCFGGCAQGVVIEELRARHLWPEPVAGQPRPHAARLKAGAAAVRRFEIRDVEGQLRAVHVRADQPGSGKRLWWELPDGAVSHGRVHPADLPLYRTHLLAASPELPVVVTEGEVAADALVEVVGDRYVVVGTVTGAAGLPVDEVLNIIAARPVILWPDHDAPGVRHMANLGSRLVALGCPSVTVVDWQDAPAGGDAVEASSAIGAEGVLALLAGAVPFVEWDQEGASGTRDGLAVVTLADVAPQAVRWLWPGWVARGRLSLLIGHPGEGKSWAALAIAAAVTSGRPFPDTAERREPGQVLFATAEDDLADTIRPRFDALGGDPSRLRAITGIRTAAGERGLGIPADSALLDADLSDHQAELLIVDPLAAFLAGELDSHRDVAVRSALAPLAKLAADHDVAVLAVVHLTKGARDTPALRAQGSVAFGAAARTVLLLGRDPEGPENSPQRHLVSVKNNLSPPPPGLMFTLSHGALVWQGPSPLSGQDLAAPWADAEERGALAEAKAVLADVLSGGSRRAKDVARECRAAGVADRTIKRARAALGVVALQVPGLRDDGWWLKLPDPPATTGPAERTNVPQGAKPTPGGQPENGPLNSEGPQGAKSSTQWPPGPLGNMCANNPADIPVEFVP